MIGKDTIINNNNKLSKKDYLPRAKGRYFIFENDNFILRKSIYTNCKKTDGCPAWSIKAEEVAKLDGATVEVDYDSNYPVTFNHAEETAFASAVAGEIAGAANVDNDITPTMGGEDFSYMLEARPGALIFIGNGDGAALHNTEYDFNDDAIPHGVSYWVRLAETALPG